MVVPKSGGCCGSAAARTSNSTKSTTKSTTLITDSKKEKDLKKRLKKLLEANNNLTAPSATVKKEIRTSSTPFKKVEKNVSKTKTSAKKDNTAANSSTSTKPKTSVKKKAPTKTMNMETEKAPMKNVKKETKKAPSKPVKKENVAPKSVNKEPVKKKATTDMKSSATSVKKAASTSSSVRTATTAAKKSQKATKTVKPATSTKRATKRVSNDTQKESAPAKKSKKTVATVKKVAGKRGTARKPTNYRACGSCGPRGACPCGPRGGCSSSYDSSTSGGCCCGCGSDYSTTEESSEDDSDIESEYYDSSDYDDDSDTDRGQGGGCNGGACGRQQKPSNGKGRGGPKNNKDSSGSWETTSDSNDNQNYRKRTHQAWDIEDLSFPIDANTSSDTNTWKCEDADYMVKVIKSQKQGKELKVQSTIGKNKLLFENDPISIQKSNKLKEKHHQKNNDSITADSFEETLTENNRKSAKTKSKSSSAKFQPEENSGNKRTRKSSDSKENLLKALAILPATKYSNSISDENNSAIDSKSNGLGDVESWNENQSESSSDCTYDYEEEESDDSDFMYDEEDFSSEEYSDYSVYESSADSDYQLPDGVEEDLLIRRGEAKIYNATDEVKFDSDDSSTRIFELPTEEQSILQHYEATSEITDSIPREVKEIKNYIESENSNDSCPELVPIEHENNYDCFESFSGSDSNDTYEILSSEPDIIQAKSNEIDVAYIENHFAGYDDSEEDTAMDDIYTNPLDMLKHKNFKSIQCKITPVDNKNVNHSSPKNRKFKNCSKLSSNLSNTSKINIEKASLTSEISEEITRSPEKPLSKFYNSFSANQVLLHLMSPIYCHGTLKVKLIAGNVSILGYNFKVNECQEVFSPRGNNLLCLKPALFKREHKSKQNLAQILSAFENIFLQSDINEIIANFNPDKSAIVLLERNDFSKRVLMVRKYMKENVFPSSIVDQESDKYHSEFILRCRFFTECFNSLYLSPEWNTLRLNDSSKLMIVGGKGVGKSTFLRYTINNNLHKFKQFLLIDLDIGQPEIFAPQTVSATIISNPILGPGFFYDHKPEKSYLYGDINIVLSPLSYLRNVKELLNYCTSDNRFVNIPWIVNTMGYNKGFGPELLSVIIEHLKPTDVVQFESTKQYNNFDYPMSPENVKTIPRNIYMHEESQEVNEYKLHHFKSVVPSDKSERWREWVMTPKEFRLTMMISMLGNSLSESDTPAIWLTDVYPYRVSTHDIDIICIEQDNLLKADLLDAVNANLVYLCNNSKQCLECFGIGIVRGVDKIIGTLYLIPSVAPQILTYVNTLAICNIPLPSSIVLNQGPKIKGTVPYTYNTNDLMTSKHVPHNIYRPQQFTQRTRNFN